MEYCGGEVCTDIDIAVILAILFHTRVFLGLSAEGLNFTYSGNIVLNLTVDLSQNLLISLKERMNLSRKFCAYKKYKRNRNERYRRKNRIDRENHHRNH